MRYIVALLFVLATAGGCKQKAAISDRAHIESELIRTMSEYLQKNNGGPDRSFTVTDVIFFAEKESYTCEFDVTMHYGNNQVKTGKMKAIISSDLSSVKRIY
jgi:hypothetical protein